ncbi:MAG: fimbrillin family protein [Duncaniella sp.]|nr:fimbrillin family protein [Duncaniella sp.]
MKSSAFLLAFSALLLASCSQDEPVAVNDSSAISFRPALGSRATETTNSNLSKFYVTSFLDGDTKNASVYFTDIQFDKGNDGYFTSAKPYYWPGDNSTLAFYAYSPSQDELGADITMTATDKKLENFAVADSIADQVDFITSYGTGNRKDNETAGLELTFSHRLSQVEVRAKSENPNYTVQVRGVRIGRPQYMGTFDFATNEWTLDDWHDTAVYTSQCDTVTLTKNAVSVMGNAGNAMLMPQQLVAWDYKNDPDNVARQAYLSVYIRITDPDGSQIYPFPHDTYKDTFTGADHRQYGWASIPIDTKWEQGKKYVYTLDFTQGAGVVDPDDPTPGVPVLGDPIKFNVNVLNWEEEDEPTAMPFK